MKNNFMISFLTKILIYFLFIQEIKIIAKNISGANIRFSQYKNLLNHKLFN